MTSLLSDLSILGAITVLVAFGLNYVGRLTPTSWYYVILNVVGALLILPNAFVRRDVGAFIVNAAWAVLPVVLPLFGAKRGGRPSMVREHLIERSLPRGQKEKDQYIASWLKMLGHSSDAVFALEDGRLDLEVQKQLFAHLYNNLDVLDGETNSLLQVSSILAAAYTFLFQQIHPSPGSKLSEVPMPLILGVLYSLISVTLCLRVVWVHWSSKDEIMTPKDHVNTLIDIRTSRTRFFRLALTLCLMAMVLVVVHMCWLTQPAWRVPIDEVAFAAMVAHLVFLAAASRPRATFASS